MFEIGPRIVNLGGRVGVILAMSVSLGGKLNDAHTAVIEGKLLKLSGSTGDLHGGGNCRRGLTK